MGPEGKPSGPFLLAKPFAHAIPCRMQKQIIALACSLVLGAFPRPALARAAALPEVLLTPIADPASGMFDAIEVTIRFNGERDGETLFNLPDAWGGEQALYQHLADIRLEGGSMTMAAAPHQRRLRHRPNARLQLRYRITRNDARVPGSGARINEYRPIVTSRYFHLIGHTIFGLPDGMADDQRVRVRFGAVPAGASFASDLTHGESSAGITLQALRSSITVGGDFTLLDAGGGARIAVRGAVDQRSNAQWRESFQKIAAAQRAFWGGGDADYLVTILATPGQPRNMATGGTGLGDAFAFFATSNADPGQLDQTMMHEFTHSWISARIGGGSSDEREAEGYWLSEGFTDYLSFRMMVRAGLWDAAMFARKFNEAALQLAMSKEAATPNIPLAARFWQDADAQQMPYLRGMLFAQLLDAQLRNASGGATSLDDVLLSMQTRAAAGEDGDAIALLRAALRAAAVDGDALIARHIDRAEPIVLPADSFAPCGVLGLRSMPQWELGFDIASTAQAKIVSGVIEGSAAWRAGLRNGMQAAGWSIYGGDVTRPAEVTIQQDAALQVIRWTPHGQQGIAVQSLELGEQAAGDACRTRLGGEARDLASPGLASPGLPSPGLASRGL